MDSPVESGLRLAAILKVLLVNPLKIKRLKIKTKNGIFS
jgi:hypothetical protein